MTFRQLDQNGSMRTGSGDRGTVDGLDEHIDILFVEDNPGDIRLFKEVFSDFRHDVLCVTRGDEALDVIGKIREVEIMPPTFVMLDLDIPPVNGFDILDRVKSDPQLQSIPVVIFSGSTSEEDIERAYDLGANAYLSKPMDVDEHLLTLGALSEFWLSYANVTRQMFNPA